jgi:hypothetical protein
MTKPSSFEAEAKIANPKLSRRRRHSSQSRLPLYWNPQKRALLAGAQIGSSPDPHQNETVVPSGRNHNPACPPLPCT